MNLEDYIKDLAPDLQEKARACGSVEELLALARENKVPLPGVISLTPRTASRKRSNVRTAEAQT